MNRRFEEQGFNEAENIRLYQTLSPVARQVIKNILIHAGAQEDVEELVQDVMYEVLAHPEKYQSERSSLGTYTAVIARSRALNHLQKLKKLKTVSLEGLMEIGYEPDSGEDGGESRILLKEMVTFALNSLKPREQKLFAMRFLYHMQIDEIASRMGCTRGAADIKLSRLRKKLRKILEAQGIQIR